MKKANLNDSIRDYGYLIVLDGELTPEMIQNKKNKFYFGDAELLNFKKSYLGNQTSALMFNRVWKKLKHLTIDQTQIDDFGKATKEGFLLLEKIIIYNNSRIGGLDVIASLKLNSLKELSIWKHPIGETGAVLFAQCQWPALKQLSLRQNQIDDNFMLYFGQSKIPKVEKIEIMDNKIGSKGVKYLLLHPFWRLSSLNLGSNFLTNSSIDYIVNAKIPLNFLALVDNLISFKSAEHLIKGKWYLTSFYCNKNKMKRFQTKRLNKLIKLHFPSIKSIYV